MTPAPQEDYSAQFLEQTLARMGESAPTDSTLLARLWFHLRPHANQPLAAAHENLQALATSLEGNAAYREALRAHLAALIAGKKSTRLLTEAGLLPYLSFFPELRRRISYKLLPPENDPSRLGDWLENLLEARDREWVAGVEPDTWVHLCELLELKQLFRRGEPGVLTDAINSLAHRIAAGGLDPELLRIAPELEEYDSPFLALHHEVDVWQRGEADDTRQIDVLLEQCSDALDRVRRRSAEVGTSIELTLQSNRLAQQMTRLRDLIALADPAEAEPCRALARLFVELLLSSTERQRVDSLVRDATGRLSRQISQFASRTGEHYIAEDRSALLRMFRAAGGGGIVIAFMAWLKIGLLGLHLPPLQETLLISLNYALGFVLIYLLHFTVATKQPAMTASLFAHTLSAVRGASAKQRLLDEFGGRVWRTQSTAILGNMLLAFATAAAFALALAAAGHAAVDDVKAARLLAEIHPLASGTLFYAAVAGVGLFLAGIVSGYYDNFCVYHRIPERLRRLTLPPRLMGAALWERITVYLEQHLGGIAGNLFFGFYLGLSSGFGQLSGLPVDIRHVAFSAANLGYAWQVFDWQLALPLVLTLVAGVVLIGLVNLTVSFSLAFYLALRATRTSRRDSGHLLLRGLAAVFLAAFRWRIPHPPKEDSP